MPTINEIAERQAWLDSLKAGDTVAYRADYGRNWCTAIVQKRTVAGWIKTEHYTFGADGRGRGDAPSNIQPVTPEITEATRRRFLISNLERRVWSNASTAALEKIVAILTEDAKKI